MLFSFSAEVAYTGWKLLPPFPIVVAIDFLNYVW
jgi:hypothetical protein